MSEIVCPICGLDCTTLGQLNRHLDYEHPEEAPEIGDVLVSWIKKTQSKVVAPFQSRLDIGKITNTLKEAQGSIQKVVTGQVFELNLLESDWIKEPSQRVDPDTLIQRNHWETDRLNCFKCERALGLQIGRQNCRKCGRLYCEEDTWFQMRLSQDGSHDPDGRWYRVCLQCYQQREGYKQEKGVSRIRSPSFLHLRTQFVAKTQLEINRLQKRLDKIAHAESPKLRKRISTLFRSNQDQIVPWEPDEARNSCHVCEQGFTLANRRHHCRLCGLLTDHKCLVRFHSFVSDRELDIKICKQCDFYLEQRGVQIIDSPISDLFQAFTRHRLQIETSLQQFNNLLSSFRARDTFTLQDQDYQYGLTLRKQLLDLFGQVEQIGRQIKHLDVNGRDEKRLLSNLSMAIVQFLQSRMFTLRMMPNVSEIHEKQKHMKAIDEQIAQLQKTINEAKIKGKLEDVQILEQAMEDLLLERNN